MTKIEALWAFIALASAGLVSLAMALAHYQTHGRGQIMAGDRHPVVSSLLARGRFLGVAAALLLPAAGFVTRWF